MREWRVRRALQPQPDGQRRWDRAYQQLLAWTQVQNASAAARHARPRPQEVAMVALYARVSTQRQAQADGVSQQLERLRATRSGRAGRAGGERLPR